MDLTLFASEISSILELIDNHKIDPIGLRQYTKLRTFFRSHTIYEAVKMFPPGHYQLGGKLIRYWELPIGEQEAPDDDELMALPIGCCKLSAYLGCPRGQLP